MMGKTVPYFILLLLMACLGPVTGYAATEIYKWVDENGQTHYSERPVDENASKIEIERPPETDSETLKRAEQREKMLRIYEEERLQKKQEDLKAQQKEEKRKQQCSQAKSRLERLSYDVPLYRIDEKGERVYLSDEDRNSEKEYWQKQVNKLCGAK